MEATEKLASITTSDGQLIPVRTVELKDDDGCTVLVFRDECAMSQGDTLSFTASYTIKPL